MTLTRQTDPDHSGEEFFRVALAYEPQDRAEIEKLTRRGSVIAEQVFLVWRRRPGEDWRRYTNSVAGSRIVGTVKREDNSPVSGLPAQRRAKEIFTRDLGEMLAWAQHLPGLRSAIEDIEMNLPGR